MARHGPLPTPNLRAINGGADHRPERHPVRLPPYRPKEPRWASVFGGDKECKRDASWRWRTMVPQLIALGELAELDVPSVEDCCIVYARIRQCERELSRELVHNTDRGLAKNPVATILNQYRAAYQRYGTEFGLSSMSRKRLGAQEPEPPDDDSDLDEPN